MNRLLPWWSSPSNGTDIPHGALCAILKTLKPMKSSLPTKPPPPSQFLLGLKSPSKFLDYHCSNFLLLVSLVWWVPKWTEGHEKQHLPLSERYGRTQTPAFSYTQGQRNLKHPTIKATHNPHSVLQPDCLVDYSTAVTSEWVHSPQQIP